MIKPSELIINGSDPFGNDKLKRENICSNLTKVLTKIREPFVMCVNSSWGNGKTTMVKMWQKDLQRKGYQTIFLNAWENDYFDDAFVSLIGELHNYITEKSPKRKNKRVNEYFNSTKKNLADLLKNSPSILGKTALYKLMGKDTTEMVLEKLNDKSEGISEDYLLQYSQRKNSIKKLKTSLQKLINELIRSRKGNEKPLFFFIDELDRCKPTFAIELLEIAKHFFDIKGIIYILSLDLDQLSNSIKAVYGQRFDARGYLRRFVDLTFNLPKDDLEDFHSEIIDQTGLSELRDEGRLDYDEITQMMEVIKYFSNNFKLSLREQQKIFIQLAIISHMVNKKFSLYPILITTLLIIKSKRPDLYYKFSHKEIEADKILDYLENHSVDNVPVPIIQYLVGISSKEFIKKYIDELKEKINKMDSLPGYKDNDYSWGLSDIPRFLDSLPLNPVRDIIFKRVDFVAPFQI